MNNLVVTIGTAALAVSILLLGAWIKRLIDSWLSQRKKPVKPPGTRLLAFFRIVCTERALEEHIKPAISDLQIEYAEALTSRELNPRWRRLKAEWMRIYSIWRLLVTFVVSRAWALAKDIVKVRKDL